MIGFHCQCLCVDLYYLSQLNPIELSWCTMKRGMRPSLDGTPEKLRVGMTTQLNKIAYVEHYLPY